MSDAGAPTDPNADQHRYWTSAQGRKWVELQVGLDTVFEPVNDLLLARSAVRPGERVLDIGCGAGATALAFAERVGPAGSVLGADISAVLLERAADRRSGATAERLAFIEADCQTHRFEGDRFDLVVSRFGVMFFADPVAAFANIRGAMRPGGRLCLAAWGPIGGNPWFSIPSRVAVARLGPPPPAPPTAPGPLAFADREHVLGILRDAGFDEGACTPDRLSLAPAGGADTVARLLTNLGPAARLLAHHGGTEGDAEAIRTEVAAALATYETPAGLRIPALFNVITATAP